MQRVSNMMQCARSDGGLNVINFLSEAAEQTLMFPASRVSKKGPKLRLWGGFVSTLVNL